MIILGGKQVKYMPKCSGTVTASQHHLKKTKQPNKQKMRKKHSKKKAHFFIFK